MMNILLIDDNPEILELLVIMLDNIFKVNSIDRCLCTQTAISHLAEKAYDLIVSDYDIPPEGKGSDIYNYIVTERISSIFVLFTSRSREELPFLTDTFFQAPQFHYLYKSTPPNEFDTFLSSIVKECVDISVGSYAAIRIHNFLRFDGTRCPVFVKLSEDKYVKILNIGVRYELEVIEKYISKGATHLYIETEYYDEFLVAFGKNNYLTSHSSEHDPLKEAKKSHLYISTLLSNIGMTEYILEISKNISHEMIKEVSKEKSLMKLLSRLISAKDYAYDHTFLITSICAQICQELGLPPQVLERLAFASLLHDIAITNTEICYIHDLAPGKISDLTEKDKASIRNHHTFLGDFSGTPDISGDILAIFRHHHLYEEGYCFNENLRKETLSMTSSIFLVAHAISDELYRVDFDRRRIRDSLTVINYKFESDLISENYKKILNTLRFLNFN